MQTRKSRRSSMPLSWPKAVPRSARRRLDAHGSFSFHRQPLWEDEHFEDRSVELSGNLLAVAVRGDLVLRRGEEARVIHEGDACLLAAGLFSVTEVPPTAIGSAEILYIFFGDQAVRRCFGDLAEVERLSLAMAAPPTALPCLSRFATKALPVLWIDDTGTRDRLARLLKVMFYDGWSGAWMFLKAFFARRQALHLHLEKYVFSITSVEGMMDAYPGGRRQFRRGYRSQYDVPVERWLTWRRLEVARLKIRYENSMSIEQIALAAGHQNFHRFRHQFRHRFKLWPEEIRRKQSREDLSAQELAPFWHWSYPEPLYVREAATAFIGRTQASQCPRRELRRLRRMELGCFGRAGFEPQANHCVSSRRTETVDKIPANVIPFESSGFGKFLELEASLNPAQMLRPLAA